MRKFKSFISLFLILVAFVGTVLPASAAPDKVVIDMNEIPDTEDTTTDSDCAIRAVRKGYSYIQDCNVVQGKTVLHITNCTWSPHKDISIGFFSTDDSKEYKFSFPAFPFASIHDTDITTEEIPSGEYWLFVYNEGNESIIGAIIYNIYETE